MSGNKVSVAVLLHYFMKKIVADFSCMMFKIRRFKCNVFSEAFFMMLCAQGVSILLFILTLFSGIVIYMYNIKANIVLDENMK